MFKDVVIFSDGSKMAYPDMMVGYDWRVRHFTHRELESDFGKIEGYRPHLIINMHEPFPRLRAYQPTMAILNDAQIIDLWEGK